MKKNIVFIALHFFTVSFGWSQNIDSLLAEPQEIELSVSTLQPRMGETFQISIDINHLCTNIFKSLIGKVELSNEITR